MPLKYTQQILIINVSFELLFCFDQSTTMFRTLSYSGFYILPTVRQYVIEPFAIRQYLYQTIFEYVVCILCGIVLFYHSVVVKFFVSFGGNLSCPIVVTNVTTRQHLSVNVDQYLVVKFPSTCDLIAQISFPTCACHMRIRRTRS